MYKVVTIKDTVRVPPKFFSDELSTAITKILREKYERIMDKDLGIILTIWNVANVSEGRIIPGDGSPYYSVQFDALVFYPELQEVFDGKVTEIVEFGAFVRMGPIDGLVHVSQVTDDFLSFDKKIPALVGKESKKVLRQGDAVRARIATVSLKSSIPETKIGLTMRPAGLGKPEWKKGGAEKPAKERQKKG
jgi:DNA-directed RNA polymerase subunit E'